MSQRKSLSLLSCFLPQWTSLSAIIFTMQTSLKGQSRTDSDTTHKEIQEAHGELFPNKGHLQQDRERLWELS